MSLEIVLLMAPGLITLSPSVSAEQPKPVPTAQIAVSQHKLIVIGFVGGNIDATNLLHREVQLIRKLQESESSNIHADIFANRDGDAALRRVFELLGSDRNRDLSEGDKSAARIVLFGHSWGAYQTVRLANQLNQLHIPVLLTIQVDSVRKGLRSDSAIPPNVREAINFYQAEGLLRGRKVIIARDPAQTKILGNHELSYRQNPVSCAGFPWYARMFMRPHVQIENDPAVWDAIEALILAKASSGAVQAAGGQKTDGRAKTGSPTASIDTSVISPQQLPVR